MAVQTYHFEGEGYMPMVVSDHWQVAQLNSSDEQRPGNISILERHLLSDETFSLVSGHAFLITQSDADKQLAFTCMEIGHTYNVPVNEWHNIAMAIGSQVLITENRDTHVLGKEIMELPERSRSQILAFAAAVDLQ